MPECAGRWRWRATDARRCQDEHSHDEPIDRRGVAAIVQAQAVEAHVNLQRTLEMWHERADEAHVSAIVEARAERSETGNIGGHAVGFQEPGTDDAGQIQFSIKSIVVPVRRNLSSG